MRSEFNRLGTLLILILILFSMLSGMQFFEQPASAKAARSTTIGGSINTDTSLNLTDSPFVVVSDTKVVSGVTLTIEPGVVIKFEQGKMLQIDGTLIANGSKSQRINFTANSTNPTPGFWSFIILETVSTGSVLNYCNITYSSYGIMVKGTSPVIENCSFSYNKNTGLDIYDPGANNIKINNNYFNSNGFGIECWSCSPLISNCFINTTSEFDGIFSTKGSPLVVNTRILSAYRSGVLANVEGKPTFLNCTIEQSKDYSLDIGSDSHITLINTNFNKQKVRMKSDVQKGKLSVVWFLNLKVRNSTSEAVPSAEVTITDNENGTFIKKYLTETDGMVKWVRCTEFIQTGSERKFYTPHEIAAIKGSESRVLSEYITETKTVVLNITIYKNYPPTKPLITSPEKTHNPSPWLSWNASTDMNNDNIYYHVNVWKGTSIYGEAVVNNHITMGTSYKFTSTLEYGQSYYVEVFADDYKGGISPASVQILQVLNSKPTKPVLSLVPAYPKTIDDLKCTIKTLSTDIDEDPVDKITYTYKWLLNGKFQEEYLKENTESLLSFIPSEDTHKNEIWKCIVTPSDGIDTGESAEIQVTIRNSIPEIFEKVEYLRLTEDQKEATELNLSRLFKDDDNDILSYRYIGNNNFSIKIDDLSNRAIIKPKSNWFGRSEITFIANDTQDECSITIELEVIAENDDPILAFIGNKIIFEDSWLNFSISADDIDSDILYFETNISLPNFNIDKSSGKVSFLPTRKDVGTLWINISVRDYHGGMDYENIVITINHVNKPPEKPEINSPNDGAIFQFSETIDFTSTCKDPDLGYGDKLIFKWYSSLQGPIGIKQDLDDIQLEAGVHEITLIVEDNYMANNSASITITVFEDTTRDDNRDHKVDDEKGAITIPLIAAMAIAVVFIVIVFLLIRRRKSGDGISEDDVRTSQDSKIPEHVTGDMETAKDDPDIYAPDSREEFYNIPPNYEPLPTEGQVRYTPPPPPPAESQMLKNNNKKQTNHSPHHPIRHPPYPYPPLPRPPKKPGVY